MDKYIEILEKLSKKEFVVKYGELEYVIKNKCDFEILKKIKSYILGEITSEQLMAGTTHEEKIFIYLTINKILNDTGKDVKYFIGVPRDITFERYDRTCLYSTEVEIYSSDGEQLKITGPDEKDIDCFEKIISHHFDPYMLEVTGDLSNHPNGAKLGVKDWFRIIAKTPYFYERMYNVLIHDKRYRNRKNSFEMDEIKTIIDKRITTLLRREDWINEFDFDYYEKRLKKLQDVPLKEDVPNERLSEEEREKKELIEFVNKMKTRQKEYLTTEEIQNIKPLISIDYLTLEEALSGRLPSFATLVARTKAEHQPITPITEEKIELINSLPEIASHLINNPNPNNENEIITLKDIIDYLQSDIHEEMAKLIYGDLRNDLSPDKYGFHFLTRESVLGTGKKRNILMLLDLLINYVAPWVNDDEDFKERTYYINKHLKWFCRDPKVINARIFGIPLIEFAKLNSPLMAKQFAEFCAKNKTTIQSQNKEEIILIAKLLSRSTSIQLALEKDLPILEELKASPSLSK